MNDWAYDELGRRSLELSMMLPMNGWVVPM